VIEITGGRDLNLADQIDTWRLSLNDFTWENCTKRDWAVLEIRAERGTSPNFVAKDKLRKVLVDNGSWKLGKQDGALDFFEGVYTNEDESIFLYHSFGPKARMVVQDLDALVNFSSIEEVVQIFKDFGQAAVECLIKRRPAWSAKTHRFYSSEFEHILILLLMINKRLQLLPKDIWVYRIFGQLGIYDPPGVLYSLK